MSVSQPGGREVLAGLRGVVVAGVAGCLLAACGGGGAGSGVGEEAPGQDEAGEAAASNRVSIPAGVRSNLGITFITVERRHIERTLRVPGRFEYLPNARREYRTAVAGRVEVLVEQFARVEEGEVLYRIDSPGWREMQQELAEAGSTIRRLEATEATFDPLWEAHERHEAILVEMVTLWEERVAQLESARDAGGGRTEDIAAARSSLASSRVELAETHERDAELDAQRQQTAADLDSARSRLGFLMDSASAVLGQSRAELEERVEGSGGSRPRWATIEHVAIRATEGGLVEELGLTNGSWADQTMAVLTVVRPDRLRFRASGLQSDAGVLRDGLRARIVPPTPTSAGRAVPLQDTMEGVLRIGLAGDPNDRTLDLIVVPEALRAWARPGVTAQLEIVTDGTASPELAIPLAAVQRDGLTPIIFRRDPANPDRAIRMTADLGKDDGRWIALLSGVREGDEVVLDGAFQLMLATSGSMQRGGHLHPDGTFHQGEDE